MAEVKIEGLEALYKQMQELPLKVEKNVMRGALRAGQKTFLVRARALVPVKSGALRKSLRIKTNSKRGLVRFLSARLFVLTMLRYRVRIHLENYDVRSADVVT